MAGARKGVMDMLDDIGSPDNIAAYVQEHLEHKKRIMGFRTPRSIRPMIPWPVSTGIIARKVAMEKGNSHWFDLAREIESVMYHEMVENKHKPIYPNVDFYYWCTI